MAYDNDLADRVRELCGREPGLAEKRMFGGLAMIVKGNMAVVIRGAGGLMVRVDPAESERLQAAPGVQPAVMRGRPMRGWLTVDPAACAKKADLRRWVDQGIGYARRLPAKRPETSRERLPDSGRQTSWRSPHLCRDLVVGDPLVPPG